MSNVKRKTFFNNIEGLDISLFIQINNGSKKGTITIEARRKISKLTAGLTFLKQM